MRKVWQRKETGSNFGLRIGSVNIEAMIGKGGRFFGVMRKVDRERLKLFCPGGVPGWEMATISFLNEAFFYDVMEVKSVPVLSVKRCSIHSQAGGE